MLTELILPVSYPMITSWQWHSTLFAITGKERVTQEWIFSNYIQLLGAYHGNSIFVDFLTDYNNLDRCPMLHRQLIKRETINHDYNNIIEFIINTISSGNYVYGVFDSNIYANRNKDKKFPHELFIFGYDIMNEVFNVGDFVFQNKYSFEKVSFKNLQLAYENIAAKDDFLYGTGGIELISKNLTTDIPFEINIMIDNIKYYLDSQKPEYTYMKNYDYGECFFGIEIYDHLINYLNNIINNNTDEYDFRPFHVLYDHKVLMLERIKYLIKNNFFVLKKISIEEFEAICNKTLIARNLFIKAELAKQVSLIKRVIEMLNEIKIQEVKYLSNMVNLL